MEYPLRLKNGEIESIKEFTLRYFESKDVWIFGSRAELDKKGGDIDIYIQTDKKKSLLESKITFLREFDKKFGEQKVDLIIDNKTKEKEIFEIAKQGVKL